LRHCLAAPTFAPITANVPDLPSEREASGGLQSSANRSLSPLCDRIHNDNAVTAAYEYATMKRKSTMIAAAARQRATNPSSRAVVSCSPMVPLPLAACTATVQRAGVRDCEAVHTQALEEVVGGGTDRYACDGVDWRRAGLRATRKVGF
jgi:hypothetical protein